MTGVANTALAEVAVVIPAWNAQRYLEAAVASVISQSIKPREVVIVDDGSTDGTARVGTQLAAAHPTVRLLTQANAGAGAARNVGVGATTEPLVAFLDADDLWAPTKLERQLSLLDREQADAVFTLAQNFISPDKADELASLKIDETVRTAFLPSALLVKRTTLERVGPFAVVGNLTDWVDWYFRLTEACIGVCVVEELLLQRRVHGDNATLKDPTAKLAYVRLLKSSLDRRRSAASPGGNS
jgi:glycosyltransferase involved in cell wall biosynthesis